MSIKIQFAAGEDFTLLLDRGASTASKDSATGGFSCGPDGC